MILSRKGCACLIGVMIVVFICLTRPVHAIDPQGITSDAQSSSSEERGGGTALLGDQSNSLTETQARDRLKTPVSLSFSNADLRNVLNGLAKTYGLNLVVDDKVKGTVNISLKGVSLGDALKQILRINGYTYVWEGSILRIINLEEEISTEVLSLNFIQPDVAMEFLKGKSSEGGVMKVDDAQNSILVTERVSRIEEMRKILKQIDIPPQQVLIQARLLDITLTDLDNLGVNWSAGAFSAHLRSSAKKPLVISAGSMNLAGPSSDLTTHTLVATLTNGPNTVTATIDALIRNQRVKVLACPTVTTLNNVEAKITIGEKFPIKETTQTTTGTLQTTRFIDVGITMRVTPKINRNGYIQLQIHPEVSSVASTIDAGPRITTREADTTLIIKDREDVIIAGLIKEQETSIHDRIPLLGNIPFLGFLFTNRAKSYEQKELVIVITPYIMPVYPPQVAKDSLVDEVRQRLDGTELYYQAQDFEFGRSLQARETPENLRILRAVDLYDSMAKQFPTHLFAPEALWRSGDLGWTRLQDAFRAEELLTRLMTQYPKSPYAESARHRIQQIQAYQKRRQAQPIRQAKKEQRQPAQNFAPSGFR